MFHFTGGRKELEKGEELVALLEVEQDLFQKLDLSREALQVL